MILRDMYCPECDEILRDVVLPSIEVSGFFVMCPSCKVRQTFLPCCNGGLGKRYRFADFPADPDFYKGQVKAGAVSVDGNVTMDNGDDKREDRRERRDYQRRRNMGRSTLTFDQKD